MNDINGCGIYSIENKVNNKVYIGSTVRSFKERRSNHINSLKRGTHVCKPLQEEFNIYGEDNFTFEILETIQDEFQIRGTEQKWLDTINPEYNVKTYVGGVVRFSEESKEKMRTSKYKNLPKIEAYTKDGVFLGVHNSQAECVRKYDLYGSDISRVLSGSSCHTKGYKFKYEDEEDFKYKPVIIPKKIHKVPTRKGNNFKGIDFSVRETKIKHARSHFKGLLKVYKENRLVGEFLSLMEMNESLGLNKSTVGACISKRRPSLRGYTFEKIARNI